MRTFTEQRFSIIFSAIFVVTQSEKLLETCHFNQILIKAMTRCFEILK